MLGAEAARKVGKGADHEFGRAVIEHPHRLVGVVMQKKTEIEAGRFAPQHLHEARNGGEIGVVHGAD